MAGLQVDDPAISGFAEAQATTYILEKKLDVSADHVVASDDDHELDGIHDGLEFPTEDERHALRRVADHVPWNAYCELQACVFDTVADCR